MAAKAVLKYLHEFSCQIYHIFERGSAGNEKSQLADEKRDLQIHFDRAGGFFGRGRFSGNAGLFVQNADNEIHFVKPGCRNNNCPRKKIGT
jgi:hypothetical protein